MGVIGLDQVVGGTVRDLLHGGDQVADTVAVHRVAEAGLRRDLVPFGDGDFPHVVSEAGDLEGLRIVPGAGRTDPNTDLDLDGGVLPMPYHDFAVLPQSCTDEAEFASAVCGLIQIHKVHVYPIPGDVTIKLGVQVQEGCPQGGQAGDPHLGRAEGVHPADQADAMGRGVRLATEFGDGGRRGQDRLEHDLDRQVLGSGEGLGDHARILRHLLEGRLSVEMLTAGDEPCLQLPATFHVLLSPGVWGRTNH